MACDIVDADALVATVVWQYQNNQTLEIGSLTMPLAKGCPYITGEVFNMSVAFRCNFDCTLEIVNESTYIIGIDDNRGYLLVLSRNLTLTITDNIVTIPKFTGAFRLGYFENSNMLESLLPYTHVYPVESTVIVDSTLNNGVWDITTTYRWATCAFTNSDEDLLMLALPHHNISNVTTVYDNVSHPLLGPARLVAASSDQWVIPSTLPDINFDYAPVMSDTLVAIWQQEYPLLLQNQPSDTVDRMLWLGSLASMVLIGHTLNQDITHGVNVLTCQLDSIRTDNIEQFVYDRTWGGVISSAGINDCSGLADDGNAFYFNHIGQYGYLVYAYAVTSFLDSNFLDRNENMALYFARNIANPCDGDNDFPLWRNKDWYTGYSLITGLQPDQNNGKESYDIGSIIMGYYGSYLLGCITGNTILENNSVALLSSEIISQQCYFQFASQNKIVVDPAFVQGTISRRSTLTYEYTVDSGNEFYPARNASIMVPMVKPYTLLSSVSVNDTWANTTQSFLLAALTDPNLEDESRAYAYSLLAVNADSATRNEYLEDILTRVSNLLPYGSTWSAIAYRILTA